MDEIDDRLQEVIDYLKDAEGYSKEELIHDTICEIKDLKGYSPDEIGIVWDSEDLMDLESFTTEFYNKVIDKVCNVVYSFKI